MLLCGRLGARFRYVTSPQIWERTDCAAILFKPLLFARRGRFVCLRCIDFLRPLVRLPHTMPRNHWQVPGTEWVQILRGPRPPSVKWPKVGQQHQRQPGKPSKPPQFHPEKGGSLSKPVWDRPSMPPQKGCRGSRHRSPHFEQKTPRR